MQKLIMNEKMVDLAFTIEKVAKEYIAEMDKVNGTDSTIVWVNNDETDELFVYATKDVGPALFNHLEETNYG